MPNDFGFDFRATQAYVTDPSYATYEIGTGVNYPTTRTVNGVSLTFGWETVQLSFPGTRDRNSALDPRIAGISFNANNLLTVTYRVDLPATGVWSIGMSTGDGAGPNAQNNHIVINDTNTQVLDCSVNTTATQVGDAAKNVWTTAQWPGSNVMVNTTFSTTILRVVLGGTNDSNNSCIGHLRLTQIASPRRQLALMGVG